jgi:hypothetical protein
MGDFSCYITINNNSGYDLGITAPPPEDGTWNNVPPTIYANQQNVTFALNDPPGPEGSEGGFVIAVNGTPAMLQANFQDGYVQENYCNIAAQGTTQSQTWSFEGASDNPDNWQPNSVPGGGHPVFLNFTFADSSNPEAKPAPAQIPA